MTRACGLETNNDMRLILEFDEIYIYIYIHMKMLIDYEI